MSRPRTTLLYSTKKYYHEYKRVIIKKKHYFVICFSTYIEITQEEAIKLDSSKVIVKEY